MAKFNDALRGVMQVSKGDLKELLAKEKAANADRPKRGPQAKIGKLANVGQDSDPSSTCTSDRDRT